MFAQRLNLKYKLIKWKIKQKAKEKLKKKLILSRMKMLII